MGKISKTVRHKLYIKTGAIIVAALLLLCAAVYIIHAFRSTNLRITENKKIDLTPLQIKSLERIGEWEFLAISDEEMVDTISKGFFGNDELSRIYYGTLRFGIDTKDANISMEEDTVMVTLPKIKLLDNDFIDEARTKSFFETGSWNNNDREKLYKKAYKAMKARCLTKENTDMAEKNAILQMKNLFKSFGFEFVKVQFSK